MLRFARLITVTLASLVVTSCMPRGETITLDQVLLNSKNEFSAASRKGLPADLTASIDKLAGLLQDIAVAKQTADVSSKTKEIAQILVSLRMRAGYTNKPGIGEIAQQYRQFVVNAGDEVSAETLAKAKLLAARTYSLVASEMGTTKFAVM